MKKKRLNKHCICLNNIFISQNLNDPVQESDLINTVSKISTYCLFFFLYHVHCRENTKNLTHPRKMIAK